jgi:nitroreductase
MDVFDGIRTLLAVRHYQDRPVPEATVVRIVEAARLTGSAMNAQPWHFIASTTAIHCASSAASPEAAHTSPRRRSRSWC